MPTTELKNLVELYPWRVCPMCTHDTPYPGSRKGLFWCPVRSVTKPYYSAATCNRFDLVKARLTPELWLLYKVHTDVCGPVAEKCEDD